MLDTLSRFYFNHGLHQARAGNPGAAAAFLAGAVAYNRRNTAAWNLLGLCCYRLSRYRTAEYCWRESGANGDQAAAVYLADLQADLEKAAPYFSRVTALCRQRKYQKAAELFAREICGRFGPSAGLLNYLGILRLLGGRPMAAAACWQEALTVDRADTTAASYLEALRRRTDYKLLRLARKIWQGGDRT